MSQCVWILALILSSSLFLFVKVMCHMSDNRYRIHNEIMHVLECHIQNKITICLPEVNEVSPNTSVSEESLRKNKWKRSFQLEIYI